MLKWLFLFLGFNVFAFARNFQTGDVLLQTLNCYVCSLISAETGSPYSHSGIVIEEKGELYVAQAIGPLGVHYVGLSKFLSQGNGTGIAHLRPRRIKSFQFADLSRIVRTKYLGLSFDPYYLWDNANDRGEMIYCSELIAKVFNDFLGENIFKPTPMSFSKYFSIWESFYGKGKVPHGKLGISPGHFIGHPYFETIAIY